MSFSPPGRSDPSRASQVRGQTRRARRLHRLVVPVAALPLALTSLSGAVYGSLLQSDIDAPWLLRLHTGNFGVVNLQPFYSPLIGVATLVLVASGLSLLLPGRREALQTSPRPASPPATSPKAAADGPEAPPS